MCIDPGHGGEKFGAIGVNGKREKDLALEIALKLKAELEAGGRAQVLMTREKDVGIGLADRIRKANEAGAALFVSIHLNSMPPGRARRTAHGVETYFLSAEATGEQARRVAALENAEEPLETEVSGDLAAILADLAGTEAHRDASALAYTVHSRLVQELEARDRGVQQAPFVVLMGAQMPAILVEVGFLSHVRDAKMLATPAYQQQAARSMARAIEEFLDTLARRNDTVAAPAEPSAIELPDGVVEIH